MAVSVTDVTALPSWAGRLSRGANAVSAWRKSPRDCSFCTSGLMVLTILPTGPPADRSAFSMAS